MKKAFLSIFSVMALAMGFTACQKEAKVENMRFTASIEACTDMESKTVLDGVHGKLTTRLSFTVPKVAAFSPLFLTAPTRPLSISVMVLPTPVMPPIPLSIPSASQLLLTRS